MLYREGVHVKDISFSISAVKFKALDSKNPIQSEDMCIGEQGKSEKFVLACVGR